MTQPPQRTIPTEQQLKTLMDAKLFDAVQQLLDCNPELKYKIDNGVLVDNVTGAELWLKKFITSDDDMILLKREAMKLSDVPDEVLITGETGTGKEIIARSMIGNRTGRFIPVNCAGLPEHLIESELFGHRAGSFTGAIKDKIGMMEAAKDGVLFLDEIGELPLSMQGKLLRSLQEKSIRRVGDNEERDINCKFVCATHRDLNAMIINETFRRDLFARISTFVLHIKPIRERKKDIEPLVMYICEKLKINKCREFLDKYGDDLMNDQGLDLSLNVRSLEMYVKRFNLLGRV